MSHIADLSAMSYLAKSELRELHIEPTRVSPAWYVVTDRLACLNAHDRPPVTWRDAQPGAWFRLSRESRRQLADERVTASPRTRARREDRRHDRLARNAIAPRPPVRRSHRSPPAPGPRHCYGDEAVGAPRPA